MQKTRISYEDWVKEGERRFGKDRMKWKFKCPVCDHVASAQEWRDAGASDGQIAFSCIGRYLRGATARTIFESDKPGPCDYAGGGLFRMNPVIIEAGDGEYEYFEFADEE